jgi:hypothetical protein
MGYQVEEGYPYGSYQNEFVCSDECHYLYDTQEEDDGSDEY